MSASVPVISVIIPVYNHQPWLIEALESVRAQSFSAWELILIDDASTDASFAVAQDWLSQQSADLKARCRFSQHTQNQGAPATLNQALALSRADYIAILNSDDAWFPTRLQRCYTLAQQQQLDFIGSDLILCDAQGDTTLAEPHWRSWYADLKQQYLNSVDNQANVLSILLQGNYFISTSNFFLHRRVYQRLGGFAKLRYVHDYEYIIRVLRAGFNMRFLAQEPLFYYRLHQHNTIRERPLAAIEENMQMLLGQLQQQPALNAMQLRGLQQQLQDLYRYTREEWLTALHQRLLAKEAELFPLIHDRDRWIAERDTWVAERDAALQTQQVLYQQSLAERDVLIAQQAQQLQRLQQHQAALYQSRDYRLGNVLLKPLRYFKTLSANYKARLRHA